MRVCKIATEVGEGSKASHPQTAEEAEHLQNTLSQSQHPLLVYLTVVGSGL